MNAVAELKVRKRILLVEDSVSFRACVAMVINGQNDLTVCGEADNAEDAIESLARTNPDVAVVDITLPGRSGIDLTREIKAGHPHVAVVILTTHSESAHGNRAFEARADSYLQKQAGMQPLLDAIRRLTTDRA